VPAVIGFSVWNALWVVFVTFTLIVVLMAMFAVIVDLTRDPDLSVIVKVLWMLALVLLPIVGLLIYVIVRGRGMSARSHAT
jgi:Phospholipase_D-nuclease N-terminal